MKCILFLIFLLPLTFFGQSTNASAYDSLLKNHPDFNGVILIAENGSPVFHKSYGYRELMLKTPLMKDDVFELASVSKQFTAMIIMMLKEKGKLNYDDLVEKYLDIPYKGISIRQLLTHTSGLPDYQEIMDMHWDKTKVAGNPDIINYLNQYAPPVLFQPGTAYKYSNTGYVLLASIAEKASGKDFIKMSRKWIFKPLKMNNTKIRTPKQKANTKNFTTGHLLNTANNQYRRADSDPSSDYTIWLGNRKGPGRVSSTADDLLKWDNALYNQKLIKQETLNQAFEPMQLANGKKSYYGFGWMIKTDSKHGKTVMHTGDNPGYKTQIIRFIDAQKTIIVLNNNAYSDFEEVINGLTNTLFNPAYSVN